jgi:hypothetical protein
MKRLPIETAIILAALVMGGVSSGGQPMNRRNPFAPLDKATRSTAKRQGRTFSSREIRLHLNGIIWNKDNPVAIINDTVIKVGSEIFDRKVSAISARQVELEYRGKLEILRIIPKIIFSVTEKGLATKPVPGTGP